MFYIFEHQDQKKKILIEFSLSIMHLVFKNGLGFKTNLQSSASQGSFEEIVLLGLSEGGGLCAETQWNKCEQDVSGGNPLIW